MELTGEIGEDRKKEGWQEGDDAALQKIKLALKMKDMGMEDCEIVKRTALPPCDRSWDFGLQR